MDLVNVQSSKVKLDSINKNEESNNNFDNFYNMQIKRIEQSRNNNVVPRLSKKKLRKQLIATENPIVDMQANVYKFL